MNDLAAPILGPRDLQLFKALDCRLTDLATDLGAQQRQQGLGRGGRRDVVLSHHERRPTTSPSPCSGCPKG